MRVTPSKSAKLSDYGVRRKVAAQREKLSHSPSARAESENSCVLSLELYPEDKTSRELSIKGYKAASLNVVDRKECKKIQRYESAQKRAFNRYRLDLRIHRRTGPSLFSTASWFSC